MTTSPLTRSEQARTARPDLATRCWCGQDLEHAPGDHCPRCGTARTVTLPPLARAVAGSMPAGR